MITITIAAPPDAVEAAGLHAAAFPDAPWDAATLSQMMAAPGARMLTARGDNGAALGFVLIRTVADEAEILTICVDAAARRQGAGRALVEAALSAAARDGAEAMFLEAAEDNLAARSLYRRADFTEVGRRRGYYRRGAEKVDAVVMKRSGLKEITPSFAYP